MTEYRLLRRTNGAGGLVESSCGRDPQERQVFLKRLAGVGPAMATKLAEVQRGFRAPRVVPVIDVGVDDESPWLVTEGIEGESLRWVMSTLGAAKSFIKPHEGLAIVQRVAEVLEPLHQRGVSHGDLCPSTIFVTVRGEVVLLDAGVAATLGVQGDLGPYRSEMGALAPEQLTGPATPASDVFRLGLVLYELSIGRPLFTGPSPAHVCHAVNTWLGLPRDKVKHVPEPWLSLLVTMLSIDPRTRPSMEEVTAVLARAAETNGWSMGDAEVAELFARAGQGRVPFFSEGAESTALRLTSVMSATPSAGTPAQGALATTPPGSVLARVATRKMTREALAAVRLEDAAMAPEPKPTAPLDVRAAQLLLERGVLTTAQHAQMKEAAARFRLTMTDALQRLGLVDEDAVVAVLAELTRTPAVTAKKLAELDPGSEALALVSAELARSAQALPLGLKGGTQLLVAMLDPMNEEALAALKESLGGKSLVTFRAGPKALAQARMRLYGELPSLELVTGTPESGATSELATRTIEALFRLQGARGFHAQALVTVATALANALGVSESGVAAVRSVTQALATAGLARNRSPWEVPKVLELQELIGFGTDAEPYAEALFEFPAKIPHDGATQAVVLTFAFAAQAGEPKPAGSRLGGALNSFRTRTQVPQELFDALVRALS